MDILKDDVSIVSVAHHPNGGGRPFTAILFDFEHRKMLGIVFEEADEGGRTLPAETVVVDVGLAYEGEIGYGVNSWRGSEFAPFLTDWSARADDGLQDAAKALWAMGSHGGSD